MTMLVYPQLGSGALSQYPIRKTRRARTVMNRAADGSTIKLADPAAVATEWNLIYNDLSDGEAGALQAFFEAAEGSLKEFTFLDPAGNLLAWSDHLDDSFWQSDPFLTLTRDVPDPRSTSDAWRLSNSGGAGQGIYQTIAAPGAYQYCLTAYCRGDAPNSIRTWAGAESRTETVTPEWKRVVMAATPNADATSIKFGVEVLSLGAVEIYGIQVDAQPGPSGYRATSRGGVYENAHFRDDVLEIVKTGVNRHSCAVNILHANHL